MDDAKFANAIPPRMTRIFLFHDQIAALEETNQATLKALNGQLYVAYTRMESSVDAQMKTSWLEAWSRVVDMSKYEYDA